MKTWKKWIAVAFGVFLIVYGGYDNSPRGQLLGALVVIGGIAGLVKSRKKNYS